MAKKKTSKKVAKKVLKKISKKSRSKKVTAKTLVKKEFVAAKQKLLIAEKEFHKAVKKHPKATKAILAGIGAAIVAGITVAIVKHKNRRKPLFK